MKSIQAQLDQQAIDMLTKTKSALLSISNQKTRGEKRWVIIQIILNAQTCLADLSASDIDAFDCSIVEYIRS